MQNSIDKFAANKAHILSTINQKTYLVYLGSLFPLFSRGTNLPFIYKSALSSLKTVFKTLYLASERKTMEARHKFPNRQIY